MQLFWALKSVVTAVLNKDDSGLRAQMLCWLFMIYTLMSAQTSHLIGYVFHCLLFL